MPRRNQHLPPGEPLPALLSPSRAADPSEAWLGKAVPAPTLPCPAGRALSRHGGKAMQLYRPHATYICADECQCWTSGLQVPCGMAGPCLACAWPWPWPRSRSQLQTHEPPIHPCLCPGGPSVPAMPVPLPVHAGPACSLPWLSGTVGASHLTWHMPTPHRYHCPLYPQA